MTVLFFIFILSLMTLSLLNSSYLELRMSQNEHSASQQFQAAETGLKLIEHRLTMLPRPIFTLHEQFNYASFQISSELRRHITPYCINQNLAYVYDVIVQAKQMAIGGTLSLKTTYAVKGKTPCQHGELTLKKVGRNSWRELNR